MKRILSFALLFCALPAWGQTVNNIDDTLTGWGKVGFPQAGGTCTDTANSQTINNASPSLDGASMLLSVTGPSCPGHTTNLLWYWNAGANGSATHFTSTWNVNIPSTTLIQENEFDTKQFIGGHRWFWGSQCAPGGVWDIWDQLHGAWVATTAACTLTAGTWHTIIWQVHRVPGDTSCASSEPCDYYDSLTVDGVNITPGGGFPPQPSGSSSDADNTGIDTQIDLNSAGGTATEYLDEVSFTASTGVPTNYYIADSGSDANLGTKASPWLRAPFMSTATGVPAAYVCNVGDQFIFKGGDTWHWGNSGASPYIGTWIWTCSGNSTNPIIIGWDTTWFTGGSFTLPIFTGDNPQSTSFPGTCTFDESTLNTIKLNQVSWVIMKGFEFPGKCWSSPTTFAASIYNYETCNVTISGNYFHGWTAVAGSQDNHYAILGNANGACGASTGNIIINNLFDCSDCSQQIPATFPTCKWDTGANPLSRGCVAGEFLYSEGFTVRQNTVRYTSNVATLTNNHIFQDNFVENLYPSYDGITHSNVLNMVGAVTGMANYFTNNLIRHIYNTQMVYLTVSTSASVTGNVIWDVMQNQAGSGFNTPTNCLIFNSATNGGNPTAFVVGNTIDNGTGGGCNLTFGPNNGPIFHWGTGTITLQNDHLIGYSPSSLSGVTVCQAGAGNCNASEPTLANELYQSEGVANGQGYVGGNNYGPTAGGSSIAAGTNLSTSVSIVYSPDTFGSFLYGTSNGASEVGQKSVYPAIYQNPRPSVWDIGAYQFVPVNAYALNADNIYCPTVGCTPSWGSTDGLATLPTLAWNTALVNTPSPGTVHSVHTSADLTNCTTSNGGSCPGGAVVCGDTILLDAGSTYTASTFTEPALVCDSTHYVTWKSSAMASLPPEGTRISPCYAGVTSLNGRPPYACPVTPGNYMAKVLSTSASNVAINFLPNTSFVRYMGLEITRPAGGGETGDLTGLPNVGNIDHVIFDRVWFHGDDNGDETNSALKNNAVSYLASLDSYYSSLYCIATIGTCTDAHAIAGGSNTINSTQETVFKIVNNFIEAAGENILFGGANSMTTLADEEIRLNTFFKPRWWNPGDPSYFGGWGTGHPPLIKNCFELKNATLALVEGNTCQNVWAGFSQDGFAYLFTALVQNPGFCATCQVTNITFRYNTANSTCSAAQWTDNFDTGAPAIAAGSWSIHDNAWDNLFAPHLFDCQNSSSTMTIQSPISVNSSQVLQNVGVNHNTAVYNVTHTTLNTTIGLQGPAIATGNNQQNINYTNNAVVAGGNGTINADGVTSCAQGGSKGAGMINLCWVPNTVTGNCFVANGAAVWPTGNVASVTTQAATYTNYNQGNAGNYVLAASACKGAGNDGLDPGANIAVLNSVLAGNPAPSGPSFTLTTSTVGSGTVTSSPAGISCPATCSASFSSGTVVTMTATAGIGYAFTSWSGACAGSGACVITMSANEAVTATFSLLPSGQGTTINGGVTISGTVIR